MAQEFECEFFSVIHPWTVTLSPPFVQSSSSISGVLCQEKCDRCYGVPVTGTDRCFLINPLVHEL